MSKRAILVARLCGPVLMACVVLAYSPVRAGASIGVSPSKIELYLEAGDVEQFSVEVMNSGDSSYETEISVWNFARDESGEPQPIPPEDAEAFHGGAQWVSVESPSSQELPPVGDTTFEFTVEVPEDAEDGTRFCYITFTAVPPAEEKTEAEPGVGVQAPMSFSLSALLLVTVGDPQEVLDVPTMMEAVSVEDLSIPPFNFDGEVPIKATIANKGNVHMNLQQGSGVQIWQGDRLVGEVPLSEYTLLPDNTIAIPAVWEPDASFGHYMARFLGNVGLDQPIVMERSFYVVSRPVLIGAAIAAVAGLTLLILFLRRFKIQLAPRRGAQDA